MAAATSTRRGGDAPVAAIRLRPRLSAGAQRLLKTDWYRRRALVLERLRGAASPAG